MVRNRDRVQQGADLLSVDHIRHYGKIRLDPDVPAGDSRT